MSRAVSCTGRLRGGGGDMLPSSTRLGQKLTSSVSVGRCQFSCQLSPSCCPQLWEACFQSLHVGTSYSKPEVPQLVYFPTLFFCDFSMTHAITSSFHLRAHEIRLVLHRQYKLTASILSIKYLLSCSAIYSQVGEFPQHAE